MGLSSARSRSRRSVCLLRDLVDFGDQHVAAAANGLDDAWALAVVTQLLAQAADLHIDAALHGQALATAGGVRDGIPVQHHAGNKNRRTLYRNCHFMFFCLIISALYTAQ